MHQQGEGCLVLGWVVVELGCPEWWVGLFGLFELGWVVWVGLFVLFGANTTQPNTTQPNSNNPTHMQNPTQPQKHDSQVGPSACSLDVGKRMAHALDGSEAKNTDGGRPLA